MRVAVTYDNGQIFQHFGRTESFKVYEIVDGEVINSMIVGSDGQGHGALAGLLDQHAIDVLICGGIGGGAQSALMSYGIEIYSGAEGDCDAAVAALLKGELATAGVTCDHHDHEEGHECHCGGGDDCDCGSEGGCGGSCGGGCGGGMPQVILEGPNAGKIVKVHYRGTFNDGTQFDSSYDRGEPLEFVCGVGMMIPGFDAAVVNMEVGQVLDIHLMPEEAYGEVDPNAVFTLDVRQIAGAEELAVGERVVLQDQYGQPVPVTVVAREGFDITFDANSEMSGKELNFHIEMVDVQDGI